MEAPAGDGRCEVIVFFLVMAALAFLEALYSAKGGLDYFRLFRKSGRPQFSRLGRPRFSTPVTLILPCKGVDAGLEDNLSAYFALDYPDFQILLVTGSASDSCVPLLQKVRAENACVASRLLFAGSARRRSQKVHNLLHALKFIREEDEILAFGDSDIRPHPGWLRCLVGPLSDPKSGLSTGFRWYLPVRGNFASVLRSVWNAGVASILREANCPFAWGGAMAVRRDVFYQSRVPGYWEGALSDDYAMSRAIQDAGREIRFEPRCLSFSHEDCSLEELLEWSARQLAITRVYQPSLWRAALTAQLINNLGLWGGTLMLVVRVLSGSSQSWPLALLLLLVVSIYILGCFKGWIRLRAVTLLFPEHAQALERHRSAYIFWGPLAALVSLWGLIRSVLSREVRWRGMRYRMVSPKETVFLGGE